MEFEFEGEIALAKRDLTNGLPAEVVMETTSKQQDDYNHHLFEDIGRVVYMNDSYYIRYEEDFNGERVPVTIKILSDGKVDLIRQSTPVTRLHFDNEKPTMTQYKTPAGIMHLEVVTNDLKIGYYDQPFAGRVKIEYSLYVGGQLLGDHKILLRFTT